MLRLFDDRWKTFPRNIGHPSFLDLSPTTFHIGMESRLPLTHMASASKLKAEFILFRGWAAADVLQTEVSNTFLDDLSTLRETNDMHGPLFHEGPFLLSSSNCRKSFRSIRTERIIFF